LASWDKNPRLKIGRAEETDVKLTVESVARLVPFGLDVGRNQMRDLIGLGKPADDDSFLVPPAATDHGGQETRDTAQRKGGQRANARIGRRCMASLPPR